MSNTFEFNWTAVSPDETEELEFLVEAYVDPDSDDLSINWMERNGVRTDWDDIPEDIYELLVEAGIEALGKIRDRASAEAMADVTNRSNFWRRP